MRRRYSLDWILVRLLIGAVLALAVENARAQFSIVNVYNTNTGAADGATITWDFDVDPALPPGSYSSHVHEVMAGNPGGCTGQWDFHPGISWDGHTATPSCADCDFGPGSSTVTGWNSVITAMPCFSGGTRTFTVLPVGSGATAITGTGGTVTRQDQASGGGAHPTGNIHLHFGGAACSQPVHVTAHWAGGAPHAAGVVANIVVGGFLVQVQCDANGCNGGDVPAAALNITGGFPTSVEGGLDGHSWAICGVEGARYQTVPTMDGLPSTVSCGGTVDAAIHANCVQPSPTPSPSASVAPSPSTTPVISPQPSPSSTPLQYETPPPNNPGTGVTNGGVTGDSISNQDIYNDVKQALDDAGTRDSHFGVPNGGFGYGNDPGGENGDAGNHLKDSVDRFTRDVGEGGPMMSVVDSIDSLELPTGIGEKKTWDVSLPMLGDLTINTTPYDGPVGVFRALCLAILIVGAWFGMVKIIRKGIA